MGVGAHIVDTTAGEAAPRATQPLTMRKLVVLIKARRRLAAREVDPTRTVTWAQWSSALREVGQSDTQLAVWREHFDRDNPIFSRVVVSDADGRMVDLSDALVQARAARSGKEFNKALHALMTATGRTQGDIRRHDEAHGRELSRTTISRMVTHDKLCSRPQQVEAFVQACGHGHEAALWVGAWKAAREGRRAASADSVAAGKSSLAPMAPGGGRAFLLVEMVFSVMLGLPILMPVGMLLVIKAFDDKDRLRHPGYLVVGMVAAVIITMITAEPVNKLSRRLTGSAAPKRSRSAAS